MGSGIGAAALRTARAFLWTALVLLALAALWEGYKALGDATGGRIPGTGLDLPIAADDQAMPHIADIVGALTEPARRGTDTSLAVYLFNEATITFREALLGLAIGSAAGLLLAVGLRESRFASRGVMPWLIASQTVPLVAVAPMVVIWGGKAGMPSWVAVTVLSAYLAFFPVTVSVLRGLNSPQPVHRELMHALAAGRVRTLLLLRFPAALPFLFAGLRLAATASVVGAIVGELSAGTGGGIGRAILTSSYYYSSAPENLYAAVLVAAVTGIVLVQVLRVGESLSLRNRSTAG
ncbi:ABC transporter permease [Streptomyces johnsoniae]|uniref:ABC transporter permease subunit n=1 Tax=Streptomyces johnsoniae TaxID=3075532 RepID=A0ABU2S487_9ACTN|nr:ABC transporter permease subunit [Streptomyces sp. DSM 41886]MDT0442440.1 ABC transporter permease subunit [Streptomyces sp. DSM 41886]